jgi:uncharacterized protein YkwD
MADLADGSLRDAESIKLGASRFQAGDQLAAGEAHIFQFRLNRNRSFLAKIKGWGVDVELIQDRNNNRQINPGDVFASSRSPQNNAELFKLHDIPNGNYYLRIFTSDGRPSRYRLVMGQRRFKGVDPEMAAFLITNEFREQNGLPPFALNMQLSKAAFRHSKNMALQDFFSHTGLDGSRSWDRIRAAGYDYSMAAENIAIGYSSADEVINAWMGSAGHRENILAPDLQEIGLGYFNLSPDPGVYNYEHHWTQTFGSPAN